VRATLTDPFDPADGPLAIYLGPDGAIRDCPSLRGILTDKGKSFELGNGGYGYNNAYIGRDTVPLSGGLHQVVSDLLGVSLDRVRRPAETLMFADAAFVNGGLIEYSFAEPPIAPTVGGPATPSLHFRHRARVNVAWTDGHVDQRRPSFTRKSAFYDGDPARFDIGWFGPRDSNEYFDLN